MKKSNNQKAVYEVFSVDAYLSTGIPKSEILELKDAFDLLDSTSTGKIDANELKNTLEAFGIGIKNKSLDIALSQAISKNKSIDFALFLQIFTAYFYLPKSKQSYSKIFKLFDDQNMGCITAKNLRRVIKQLQVEMDENEIQEMIERADADNDGVVSQQQFYLIMRKISSKI